MTRKKSKVQRSQRIFWILSLVVVLSMVIGLFFSFAPPRPPRITPTPVPTITPFPTRTPTPEPG